jgi:hypothetical protein
MAETPRVKRSYREVGIRFPDGQVVTGANIPDHRVLGEVEVSRYRTTYQDDVTEWRAPGDPAPAPVPPVAEGKA